MADTTLPQISSIVDSVVNPFYLDIDSIELKKMNGEKINILPQVLEFSIFQSLFSPLLRAELSLYDAINLHVNFPLLGEEEIEISFKKEQRTPTSASATQNIVLKFMIESTTEESVKATGREKVYKLFLYSIEMKQNLKKRNQKAYNLEYYNVIEKIIKEDLESKKDFKGLTDDFKPQKTRGVFHFIVPNLKPVDAIMWINKRSVPEDLNNNYFLFFERFDGFYFTTLQKMIETGKKKLPIKKFTYNSNYLPNHLQEGETYNQITGIKIDKKFSLFEKVLAGYYENEYVEIDIFNRIVRNVTTSIKDDKLYLQNFIDLNKAEKYNMNTDDFIESILNKEEGIDTKQKIKYAIFQGDGDDPDPSQMNYFKEKYGSGLRTQSSFAQLNLSVSIPGNAEVEAGEIVEIEIPPFDGFSTPESQTDKYISGIYIATDVKHIITPGGRHVTVMNLHRDSFVNKIDNKMIYNTGDGGGTVNLPPVNQQVNQN